MSSPRPAAHELRALAGAAAFDRGLDYARRGRVAVARWDALAQTLTAEILGAERTPYRCRVRFDGTRIMSMYCSCPVTGACKHIVAAILEGTDDIDPAAPPPQKAPAAPAPPAPREPWEQFGAFASRVPPPIWRMLVPPSAAAAEESAPLALGIELRVRGSGSVERWGPAALQTATPRDLSGAHGEIMLVVRPLMRSTSSNRWIHGDVSWDSVRRGTGRFRPEHARWFVDFLNIARDSLLSGTAGDWIALDRVESTLLWHHLDALPALGIPIVPTQKHTAVRLGKAAQIGLRLEPADEGGLRVGVAAEIDDEPVAAASLRPIGAIGVYRWQLVGAGIEVTLAPVPMPPAVLAVLNARSVSVPPKDVAGFVAEAYPVLARQTTVQAPAHLALPPLAVPEPVLRVTFRSGHRVTYRFEWDYAGHPAVPLAPGPEPHRDPEAERRRENEIEALWSAASPHPFRAQADLEQVAAAEWADRVLPAFERSGITVVVTGRRTRYRELTGSPQISVSTVETTDPDWFDLGVLVTIDGHSIPFAPLFSALSMRRTKLLLVDGTYFSLAHPALQQLRELIDEAGALSEWETGPRISRYQSSLWEDFEDLADQSEPARSWRATAEALRAIESVPATPPPAGLQAALRPYQRQGLDWLAFLWKHRLGGILADDMGLGKTLQLLALVAHVVETEGRRPFLVVAPTSVLGTWRGEAARFTPQLRVHVVEATAARRHIDIDELAAQHDIVVTSYTLLRLDAQEYQRTDWAAVILDEAQVAKNPATKVHQAIAGLSAEATFAVVGDLPEKQVQELFVDLAPAHRAMYDTVLQRERQKVLGLLADLDRNRFIVFRSLTMLRMLALSPRLIDPEGESVSSAKLDVLIDQVQELRAEGHRALIFSQFTSYLSMVAERLGAAGIDHAYLDGSTRRRQSVIDGFRAGDAPVFLISLKAGGVGLTLTEADYVFLLDPWWNPAAESQAIDRTHRIGQSRAVFVYRLIAAGTIEEKVLALQQRKARLFTTVMDEGSAFAQALTADDIRGLLEE